MEPNEEAVVEAPEETEVVETEESTTQETPKAEKPKETPEAKKARLTRQLAKVRKELGEADEEPELSKPKSSDLDYGQKAFLATYGIKGSDELALVKSWVSRTGDDIDALVSDDIFQAKLTQLRDARTAKEAIPSTSKRSTASSSSDVDYWLAKPFSEVPREMKAQVLNARIAREKSSSQFSETPIVQ